MKIIIPMSGFGERFRRAGYTVPKPLILIDGKPIIEHVVEMFPGETDFIFICNRDHLNEPSYGMRETVLKICPTGTIVDIEAHRLGPVHAVQCIADMLNPDEQVIVNYCDFTCFWDWDHFKTFVRDSQCDGAVPAYNGFHPHSLGTTNYAYMKETGLWLQDIQEKQPFTQNRMNEYASSGTYYFRRAEEMLAAFDYVRTQDFQVGGEYYVSLAYKALLKDEKRIAVYPLQHFMQWGTPEDVAEYRQWSDAFAALAQESQHVRQNQMGCMVMLMAGLGKRFSGEGFEIPKPLIDVSGSPMFLQAALDQPMSAKNAFVVRNDMPGVEQVISEISSSFPSTIVKRIDTATQGQACTAKLGVDAVCSIHADFSDPITFAACDNGLIYDTEKFSSLLVDDATDIILWGVRGYTNAVRNPKMYGWIDVDGDNVRAVSVKAPLSNPEHDPIVIGTFTFRNPTMFQKVLDQLLRQDLRVNGEFYLDSCMNVAIEMGLNCRYFEIDHYLNWGTPNDLWTFQYWQSCFHKWASHPYSLEKDRRVTPDSLDMLAKACRAVTPTLPVT